MARAAEFAIGLDGVDFATSAPKHAEPLPSMIGGSTPASPVCPVSQPEEVASQFAVASDRSSDLPTILTLP